jgi:hypothetical protein
MELLENPLLELAQTPPRGELGAGSRERSVERREHISLRDAGDREGSIQNSLLVAGV